MYTWVSGGGPRSVDVHEMHDRYLSPNGKWENMLQRERERERGKLYGGMYE